MLHIDTRMHTPALLPPLFSLVLAQLFSYVSSKHSYNVLCAHLSFCSAEAFGCCHKCNSKSLAPCFCRTQPLGPSLELREMLSRTPCSAAHRPVSVPLPCHVKQQKGCCFSLHHLPVSPAQGSCCARVLSTQPLRHPFQLIKLMVSQQQAGTPPYLCPHTFQWQQDELLLPA